jgi:pilus assembly protein Flp/PilA
MMNGIWRFLCEEDGPTAVEYAVMLALILLVCIGAVASVGTQTSQMMDPGGQLTGALGSGGS